MVWQLQEAKQRFSELVRKAEAEGPQVVSRNGREVVVVVAVEEFHGRRPPKMNFKEFLMSGLVSNCSTSSARRTCHAKSSGELPARYERALGGTQAPRS